MSTVTESTQEGLDQVSRWRWEMAVGMGYSPILADEISRHTEIDLHELRELIKRGCDLTTAFEILRA